MSWANNGQVDFVTLDGRSRGSEDFLISTWRQSDYMTWSADNVLQIEDTGFTLTLDEAEDGDLQGGEVQSASISDEGLWSWYAQAPDLDSGAVFAMFLYRADHNNDPWLEFDFEFIQGSTTSLQLAVHMEDEDGTHHYIKEILDLDFDASASMHLYEFDVTETETNFLIDNEIVWTADASDMPDDLWVTGDMKAFSSLWAAVTLPSWAGEWDYSGTAMVGEFNGFGTPENALFAQTLEMNYQSGRHIITGFRPFTLTGSEDNDKITGGKRADQLEGLAGDDFIFGEKGRDIIFGGDGHDILGGGTGFDVLDGGAGDDVLMGGKHQDVLTGGLGSDVFVVGTYGGYKDTITDFSLSEGDILDLTGMSLTSASDLILTEKNNGNYLLSQSGGNTIFEITVSDDSTLSVDILVDQDALYF